MDELQQEPKQQEHTAETQPNDAHTRNIVLALAGIALVSGLVWWYMSNQRPESMQKQQESAGLGAELFEDVDNPIEDRVPKVQTTANPIEDFYTNPFE